MRTTSFLLSLAALSGCTPVMDWEKFDLAVEPARITLQPGSSRSVTVSINRKPGFKGAVWIVPPQGTLSFASAITPNPIPADASSATLTLTLPTDSLLGPGHAFESGYDVSAWDATRASNPGRDAVFTTLWIKLET